MTSREVAHLLAWLGGLFALMYCVLMVIGDESKPMREPCAFGQRPYAELVEQKADAGAVNLKIVVVCREQER